MSHNLQIKVENLQGDTATLVESYPETQEVGIVYMTDDQIKLFESGEAFDADEVLCPLEEVTALIEALQMAIDHAEQFHEFME